LKHIATNRPSIFAKSSNFPTTLKLIDNYL
jgi:hypothetical protein